MGTTQSEAEAQQTGRLVDVSKRGAYNTARKGVKYECLCNRTVRLSDALDGYECECGRVHDSVEIVERGER